MPAYAPNFTPRVKVRYHAAFAGHTQLWRIPQIGVAGINLAASIAGIQAVYDLLTPIMYDDWTINDVSYADINSDVFLPTTGLTVIGTVGTAGIPPRTKAQAVSFVGRSAAGGPAKIAQFGVAMSELSDEQAFDFRISAGENVTIDGVIALLNTYTSPLLICANDILGVSWKGYANAKPYDFWVKKVRTGG